MAGYSVPDFSFLYQGLPASGGTLYVYQTGTTTPVTIYSDGGLTTPISNPGTLDANGALKFYVSGSVNLRLDAYTATGQFIQSIDPVYPVSGATASTGQVVYEGSNITLSTTNNGNNLISTAAINIALPVTTGFTNTFQVELNAQGGAITLIPNSADKINGGTAGASYVLAQGTSAQLWTDAAGNWGLNYNTNAIVSSSIIGTTTNNNAAAGIVGEYISSTVLVGSAVTFGTGSAGNVTSISLTAGDWDVWGTIAFLINPATNTTYLSGWINTTSATQPTSPGNGALSVFQIPWTTGSSGQIFPVGQTRLSLASTTTVYLSGVAVFSTNSLAGYGFIGARRVR